MPVDHLVIIDRILLKQRTVIREIDDYYRVYLPMEYNELWERLFRDRRSVGS